MNRPEPIELENNLGPDAVTGEINRVPWMAYDVDEMDIYIAEKDAEIAELKKKLMPCLNGDCILTCEVVEKYGKENAELKKKLEDVQASHYAESVDAGMRERKLKRALWLTRAFRARDIQRWWIAVTCSKTTERACSVWNNVERKCRAKAEEFK
jgi:hypothetical protein